MASGAKTVWFLVKWIVVPVALGALGFFVIGPRIGQTGLDASSSGSSPAQESRFAEEVAVAAREQDSAPRPEFPAPDVSVTSRPVDRATRREREPSGQSMRSERERPAVNKRANPERPSEPQGEAVPSIDDPASSGGMVDPEAPADQSNP
jgi:hypothetical protein